jgi:hypothetical protein
VAALAESRAIEIRATEGGVMRMMAESGRGATCATVTLLEEANLRGTGCGPAVAVGEKQGGVLAMMLDVTRAIHSSSLTIWILGSVDGLTWDPEPLLCLPQKYYCGIYEFRLDLGRRTEVRYLRVGWTARRLVADGRQPEFTAGLTARATSSQSAKNYQHSLQAILGAASGV